MAANTWTGAFSLPVPDSGSSLLFGQAVGEPHPLAYHTHHSAATEVILQFVCFQSSGFHNVCGFPCSACGGAFPISRVHFQACPGAAGSRPCALARLQDAGIYDAEVHAALFQLGIVRPLACVDAVFVSIFLTPLVFDPAVVDSSFCRARRLHYGLADADTAAARDVLSGVLAARLKLKEWRRVPGPARDLAPAAWHRVNILGETLLELLRVCTPIATTAEHRTIFARANLAHPQMAPELQRCTLDGRWDAMQSFKKSTNLPFGPALSLIHI